MGQTEPAGTHSSGIHPLLTAVAARLRGGRYSGMVYAVALKILADCEEARDVQQQVFLKLHTKASLYSADKGTPAAWLAAIAGNCSIDQLRKIKNRRMLGEKLFIEAASEEDSKATSAAYADYLDEMDLLHPAMAVLRPKEVQVLELAFFGGLSHREISVELAQPLGSIKACIRRSLIKLRSSLAGLVHQQTPREDICPVDSIWSR